MKVKYFILSVNVQPTSYSAPTETGECFMFWKIFSCLTVFGNIRKSYTPSIKYLIIYTQEHFALIIFVFGHTLFRWDNNAMKYPVNPESSTMEFSSFFLCVFVVGALAILLNTYAFSSPL